jgi:hypothetical protein
VFPWTNVQCQIHCLGDGDNCLHSKYLLQLCSTCVPVIGYVWMFVVCVCYVSSSIVDYHVLSVEKHPTLPRESLLAMVCRQQIRKDF